MVKLPIILTPLLAALAVSVIAGPPANGGRTTTKRFAFVPSTRKALLLHKRHPLQHPQELVEVVARTREENQRRRRRARRQQSETTKHSFLTLFPTTTRCDETDYSYVDPRRVARSVGPSVALVEPIGVRNVTTSRGSGFVVQFPPAATALVQQEIEEEQERDTQVVLEMLDEIYNNNEENGEALTTTKSSTNRLYLLTAAHVAAPGHRMEVTFYNPQQQQQATTKYSAKIVGRKPSKDLALLCIEEYDKDATNDGAVVGGVEKGADGRQPRPLPLFVAPAETENSNNNNDKDNSMQSQATTTTIPPPPPEIGTPVFCFGYPSGGVVGVAMTSGIVCGSAQGLQTPVASKPATTANHSATTRPTTTRFVVTNSAMAGGMSGGPLVTAQGYVLGVNALINLELRALGNYAIDAMECHAFLTELAGVTTAFNEQTTANDKKKKTVSYRVMLYNDPFNKRERVATVLQTVANLTTAQAETVMMKAHTTGRSVICEYPSLSAATVGDNNDDHDDPLTKARALCDSLRNANVLVEVVVVVCTNKAAAIH